MGSVQGVTPVALRKGDTIAIISPSGRLNDVFPHRIERSIRTLETLGYNVRVIFSKPLPVGHLEQIQHRCTEIHLAFSEPAIKAIICSIGGLSANELLPHLDYTLIAANPKIFCGYSDITLLHSAIFTQTGLRTFYGPACIPTLGEFPHPFQFSIDHFMHVLRDAVDGESVGRLPASRFWTQEFLDWSDPVVESSRPRSTEPSPPWKWLRSGVGTGRLFGGCLPSILQLTGTKYQPSYSGRILLLETPEFETAGAAVPLEFVRSWLADLVLVGIIGPELQGMVLGRPYAYDEAMRDEFEQIVLDQCYMSDFPILANVDVGHTDPILTIPLNAMVRLDSDQNLFEILEAGVISA